MRIYFSQCWSKVCKIRIKSFGYKEGIFNLSAINQKINRKSCVSLGIQKLFNNIPACMYSCTLHQRHQSGLKSGGWIRVKNRFSKNISEKFRFFQAISPQKIDF